MSKYDNASLVMIPSGFKAEKLYSVLPENGNGDFTHDRNGSTATRVNKDGYVETVSADVPRLNYIDGVVQDCPHLLLEPQRTNLYLNHDLSFNTIASNVNRITNTTDVLSPANDNTALKVIAGVKSSEGKASVFPKTADGNNHNFTANTDYVSSVFVKKGTFDFIQLILENFSGFASTNVYFDVSTGMVGTETNATGFIEDFGNGWYRCSMKFNLGSNADLLGRAIFRFAEADGDNNVPRTGTEHMYFWGAQLEEGSYPTSLIQTSGTAETRSADVCNGAGTSAEFNDSEGVLFAEVKALDENVGSNRKIVLGDGSYNNGIEFGFQVTSNSMQFIIRSSTDSSGITMNIQTTAFNVIEFNKIAISYKSNEGKVFVNGSQVGTTDTSVVLPANINQLDLKFATAFEFEGLLKQLAVFNKALTDSELEALTT